jgi:hypothetical protein
MKKHEALAVIMAASQEPEMAELADLTTTEKVTADEVDQNCPSELQGLAERIIAHLEKAEQYKDKAEQHRRSAGQCLAEAQKVCNVGGFKAFREKFFPQLQKSRVYQLLQIATDKKSVEEVRADTRERVQRSRANKAASATVAESSVSTAEPQANPDSAAEAHDFDKKSIDATKPMSGISPADYQLFRFTTAFVELARVTERRQANRFAKTAASADDLARVGELLSRVASLKKSSTVASTMTEEPPPGRSLEPATEVEVSKQDQQAAA